MQDAEVTDVSSVPTLSIRILDELAPRFGTAGKRVLRAKIKALVQDWLRTGHGKTRFA
jgi:hypothetical protein